MSAAGLPESAQLQSASGGSAAATAASVGAQHPIVGDLEEQPARAAPRGGKREPFRVAAVQMVSGGDVAANLAAAASLIAAAVAQGARLVLLPEYFGIFGAKATDKVIVR